MNDSRDGFRGDVDLLLGVSMKAVSVLEDGVKAVRERLDARRDAVGVVILDDYDVLESGDRMVDIEIARIVGRRKLRKTARELLGCERKVKATYFRERGRIIERGSKDWSEFLERTGVEMVEAIEAIGTCECVMDAVARIMRAS